MQTETIPQNVASKHRNRICPSDISPNYDN